MNVLKSWGEGANHKTWLTELKVVASGELDDCCEKEELRSYRVFANVLEIIIFYFIFLNGGFPSGSVVKNLPAMQDIQETWVRALGWEDPLEEEMAPHCSILAWEFLVDRGAWWATVH